MIGTVFVIVGALAVAIIGHEAVDRALANVIVGRDARDKMKGGPDDPRWEHPR